MNARVKKPFYTYEWKNTSLAEIIPKSSSSYLATSPTDPLRLSSLVTDRECVSGHRRHEVGNYQ